MSSERQRKRQRKRAGMGDRCLTRTGDRDVGMKPWEVFIHLDMLSSPMLDLGVHLTRFCVGPTHSLDYV